MNRSSHTPPPSIIRTALVITVLVGAAALVVADHWAHRHGHFEWEARLGFYGWFSLAVSFALAVTAWLVRPLLQRRQETNHD